MPLTNAVLTIIRKPLRSFTDWYSLKGFGGSDQWFYKAIKHREFKNRPQLLVARDTNYHKLNRIVKVVDEIERWTAEHGLKRADVRVLEIGCGRNPVHSLYLADLGYRVTGIDMYESEITAAGEKAQNCSNPELLTAEAGSYLEKLSRPFNVILALDVLQMMKDPEKVVRLASQSLASPGLFLVIVPDGYSEIALLYQPVSRFLQKKILNTEVPYGFGAIQKFSLKRINKVLAQNGLDCRFVCGIFSSRIPFIFTFPFGFRGWPAYWNIKASGRLPSFMTSSWLVRGLKR